MIKSRAILLERQVHNAEKQCNLQYQRYRYTYGKVFRLRFVALEVHFCQSTH